ncbi:hypothetical protein Tco_0261703 [Tanacetum coccineum]
MERKIDEWEKSQNISSEQTDRTDPPPPQAHTEHVNVVFTRSGKSADSPKIQTLPPIIVEDKPIKTLKMAITAIDESVVEHSKSEEEKPLKEFDVTNEVERRVDDKPAKSVRENIIKNDEEDLAGVFSSHVVRYYLKHRINEKIIEGLVENQKFNDSLSAARLGKMKRKLTIHYLGDLYTTQFLRKNNQEGGHRRKLWNAM